MEYGYIYVLQNVLNEKYYVGQSIDPEVRINRHLNYPGETVIGKAIKKHGKENFIHVIIDGANTQQELNVKEEEYICLFQSKTRLNGYNVRDGGRSSRIDNETRQKMSKAQKKEKHSQYIELDDNEIIRLYINEGKTQNEISETMNCSRTAIRNHLVFNEIERRSNAISKHGRGLFGFTGAQYKEKEIAPWNRVWRSQIRYNGHRTELGLFNDPLSCEIVYMLVLEELEKIRKRGD